MAQIDGHQGGGQDANGLTARQLLDNVTVELATFEAKKLAELKAELGAFVAQQEALVGDYKAKYEGLRKQWCDRQRDLERLCHHIGCEFPLKEEKWRKAIERCICEKQHALCCLEQRIAVRKRCCAGPNQRARDAALAEFERTKKRLEWMTTLVKSLETILQANAKLAGDIEKTPATDRPVVLYLFIKLRQAHLRMAPSDAPENAAKLCGDWDIDKLCQAVYGRTCEDEDSGCTPREKPPEGCKPAVPGGPSLIAPNTYSAELDKAWLAYREAREKLADAEAKLKQKPDDIESLVKKLDMDTKGLDDAIKKCLKEVEPSKDDCNKQAEPGRIGVENA